MPILKTEEQRKAFMETLMWVSRAKVLSGKSYHTIRIRNSADRYFLYEGNGIIFFVGGDGMTTRYVDGIEAKMVKMAAWPYYEGDL